MRHEALWLEMICSTDTGSPSLTKRMAFRRWGISASAFAALLSVSIAHRALISPMKPHAAARWLSALLEPPVHLLPLAVCSDCGKNWSMASSEARLVAGELCLHATSTARRNRQLPDPTVRAARRAVRAIAFVLTR